MKKAIVAAVPINDNYKQALDKIFQLFPDAMSGIKDSKRIFIKINLDHLYEYHYTNPDLLQLLLEYIRRLNPGAALYVMENNFHGNFVRLLAKETGIFEICKSFKAKFIYIDEKKSTTVTIGKPEDRYRIQFPEILLENLIAERKECFYLNLATLKTHFQLKIAAALYNQVGLLSKLSAPFVHSIHIHKIIPFLFQYIKPDLTVLDANVVLSHGLIQPESILNKNAIPVNRLLAGPDAVAVDRAALALCGYRSDDVQHLKIAIDNKFGQGTLDEIVLKGNLPEPARKIPYDHQLSQLPPRMDILIGRNKTGTENCLGLAIQVLQILYKDFGGDKRFTIVTGSEFTEEQLKLLKEPVVVLGGNACKETAHILKHHYYEVYFIEYCHDIRQVIAVFLKVLSINRYNLIGSSPFTTRFNLLISRLKGSKYKLPTIKRTTRRWREPKKKIVKQKTGTAS